MSPPAGTPGLYDLMQALRIELLGRMDKHGERLVALGVQFEKLAQQNQDLKDRIRDIEFARKYESEDREQERTADRRISAVIATAATVVAQIGKAAWTFYHPSNG